MLICNAVLTDADGARPGDVRIENGVITAVGEGLSAGGDTVLDAGGRTLLPALPPAWRVSSAHRPILHTARIPACWL